LRNRVDLNGGGKQGTQAKRHFIATLTEPHDLHGSDGLHACVDSYLPLVREHEDSGVQTGHESDA